MLAGKIFMVQMQPVKAGKLFIKHFLIIDDLVRYLGIIQNQHDGVRFIQDQFILRRVHGYSWRFFKADYVLINGRTCNLFQDLIGRMITQHLV
jgi:hypothetical protein